VNDIEQAQIIEIFDGIPPIHLNHYPNWAQTKAAWTVLKKALTNYFSGEDVLLGIEWVDPELLKVTLDRYLSLYTLINWGWKDIQFFFEGVDIPLKPGDAFRFILEGKAVDQATNGGKTSTRTLYDGYKFLKKCQGWEKQGKLTKAHKSKLDVFTQRLKKKNPAPYPEYLIFLNACLEACRTSKSKQVREKLQEYYRKNSEWQDYLLSRLHPRQAAKPEKRYSS
jgi:hypothetical protein